MELTLKAARTNKNLTQKEAADLIGISVYTLGNYERGRSYPDVPIIQKMEKIYNVKYEDIYFLPINCPLRAKNNNDPSQHAS